MIPDRAALLLRGCGNLNHVGPHPGTVWLVGFVALGTVAAGWRGGVMALTVFGPLYLHGAYERAKYSDLLSRRMSEAVDEWAEKKGNR